jgi:acetolactate synthase I/II/III large subunit
MTDTVNASDVVLAPSVGAATRSMTGGLAVAEMFRLFRVEHMFGMGGFQLLPFYAGVRELGLSHCLIDDERSGAFAADAQARVTHRAGVCDATLGPGTTNLVTALVESLNAGVPLVALVGDTHRDHSWKNMTQESRQLDILRPAVKDVIRIEAGHRIPELIRRAFSIATSGRPGPVLVALPEDISHGVYDFPASDLWADPAMAAVPARRTRPAAQDIEAAARLLSRSRRPVVLAGGGVHLSGASHVLSTFAAAYGIPVAHTLSGKGAIACTDPLSIGLFGRYNRYANELIEESDCLLVIGCKLGEIATKRYSLPRAGTPLIHLDVVAEEIGRWARVNVGLWGDARCGLEDLHIALAEGPMPCRQDYLADIATRAATWHGMTNPLLASAEQPIHMARLIAELNSVMPADGLLVADGGFASHWAGLLYDTKQPGRGFISDRGFASIGYGLPGALGAQLAAPDRTVVGITGDGGLNMTIGGLETARRVNAAFTLIVVNNAASGYVKALQHAIYGPGSYQSSDLVELDYAALARGFGCGGIRVEDPAELGSALRAAMAERDRPTVVDVVVTRDPGRMLPGVDSRVQIHAPGDRIA